MTAPRSSAAIAREPVAPLAAAPRQEALEDPARAGDPATPRRPPAPPTRPGIGTTRAALGRPGRDELLARVAHGRRAGVGHEREVGAGPEVGEQLRRAGRVRSGRGSSTVRVGDRRSGPSRRRVSRVSSAAMSGTARRTSSARNVTSPRLPIGVATT